MARSDSREAESASELISKRISELGDWRGETLSRVRELVKEADPYSRGVEMGEGLFSGDAGLVSQRPCLHG